MINTHLHIKKTMVKRCLIILVLGLFTTMLSAQSLTGISPDEGMQGETLQLTISGQNTHFLQATSVSVNLQQGTATLIYPYEISFQSDETLNAAFGFTWAHDPGISDLRVANEIDGVMMMYDAFEVLENPVQPELVSINPNTSQQGEMLEVFISGQNTHFQASTTTVALKQGTFTIYPLYSDAMTNTGIISTFSFTAYHPTGLYDVYTYNDVDGELELENSFTLTAGLTPQLSGIDPPGGIAGTMLEFDVYGENTHFMDATSILAYLSNNSGQFINLDFDILGNTHLQGTIILSHISPDGYYDLEVINNIDGTIVLEDAFFLEENTVSPEVLYMEPDSAYLGDFIQVNAYTQQTWFDWAQTLNAFMKKSGSFQNIYNQGIQIVNNEQLEIDFDISVSSIPGYYDLYITDNLDGQVIGTEVFYVIDTITGVNDLPPPETFSVYPNPAHEYIYISGNQILDNCSITIFNYAGQRIRLDEITLYPGVPIRVNVSKLVQGVSFIQLISNEKMIHKKLIKY